jgi:hypothetical protein
MNALMLTALNGHGPVVATLVSGGAKVDAADQDVRAPFDRAPLDRPLDP